MFPISIIFRVIVISLLVWRTIYWHITASKAAAEKPKTKKRTMFNSLHFFASDFLNLFIFIQLLGLNILPFKQNLAIEIIGLFFCIIAVIISYFGRKELGTNWADAAEYQVKKNHTLVTSGIYKYIRHPIYTGVLLFLIGAELVAGSWLVIPFGVIFLVSIYIQGKREEKILIQHFGKKYTEYIKKSKMFIPNIF